MITMFQKTKKQISNPLNKRCDSCGNPASNKKYNHCYLCFSCLHFDKQGRVRVNGQLVRDDSDYGRYKEDY